MFRFHMLARLVPVSVPLAGTVTSAEAPALVVLLCPGNAVPDETVSCARRGLSVRSLRPMPSETEYAELRYPVARTGIPGDWHKALSLRREAPPPLTAGMVGSSPLSNPVSVTQFASLPHLSAHAYSSRVAAL